MTRVVMMTEMSWQVNEEVSRDMTGEADGMNHAVDSRDGLIPRIAKQQTAIKISIFTLFHDFN